MFPRTPSYDDTNAQSKQREVGRAKSKLVKGRDIPVTTPLRHGGIIFFFSTCLILPLVSLVPLPSLADEIQGGPHESVNPKQPDKDFI